jgi:hypothetical protein
MTPRGLLFLLEQAEAGKIWPVEFLNAKTAWEDFKNFGMETIYRFSQVCDVEMGEFFEPAELLEAGYIDDEEYSESNFSSLNAEGI